MNPLLLLALFGFGLGFGDAEISKFERLAAAEILSRLSGDSARVQVDVVPDGLAVAWGSLTRATITASDFSLTELPLFTEPERSQAGRLGELRLRLYDFELRGLRIKELRADIPGCRYDFGLARSERTFRLSKSGVGTGSVKILEQDLADYIVMKYAEVKSATVKVYNDVVWVEGYGEFLIFKTEFAIIAKLTAVEGTKLDLTDAKIYFNWRRADPAGAQALLDLLNPVIDLDEDLNLHGAISVGSIRLRDGVLLIEGDTKIPVRPKG